MNTPETRRAKQQLLATVALLNVIGEQHLDYIKRYLELMGNDLDFSRIGQCEYAECRRFYLLKAVTRTCSKACWNLRRREIERPKKMVIALRGIAYPTMPVTQGLEVAGESKGVRRLNREQSAEGAGFTDQEFKRLCGVYGGNCLCCGSSEKVIPDHVKPLVFGGSHSIGNIQPLCWKCNRRKGQQVVDYRLSTDGGSYDYLPYPVVLSTGETVI